MSDISYLRIQCILASQEIFATQVFISFQRLIKGNVLQVRYGDSLSFQRFLDIRIDWDIKYITTQLWNIKLNIVTKLW